MWYPPHDVLDNTNYKEDDIRATEISEEFIGALLLINYSHETEHTNYDDRNLIKTTLR